MQRFVYRGVIADCCFCLHLSVCVCVCVVAGAQRSLRAPSRHGELLSRWLPTPPPRAEREGGEGGHGAWAAGQKSCAAR